MGDPFSFLTFNFFRLADMGFVFLGVVLGYLFLAAIVIGITARFAKSKKVVFVIAILFAVFPFRRLIFYKALFSYYSRSPLQEIHETVESPISVYWEDNVWPGFDEIARKCMVKTYLDGIHLRMLALNGDDGKIYLYQADAATFAESEKMRPALERKKRQLDAMEEHAKEVGRKGGDNHELWRNIREFRKNSIEFYTYAEVRERELQGITERVEILASPDKLPPMNYRVEFNSVSLGGYLEKKLHADRISIIDEKKNQEIAFSQRYLAYAGFISQISGEQPMFDYKLGDFWAYRFDDKVLFEFATARRKGSECHSGYLNSRYDRRR